MTTMMMSLLLFPLGVDAQSRRNWYEIRNNRNNDVQIWEPIPISNNFRESQPVGNFRKVYRTPDASGTCAEECEEGNPSVACKKPEETGTKRRRAQPPSSFWHWDYADQPGWHRWTHPVGWVNECGMGSLGPTHPGESPIKVDPISAIPFELGKPDGKPLRPGSGLDSDNYVDTVSMSDMYIKISDSWKDWRPQMFVFNNGHTIKMEVCGNNPYDCKTTANFGDWPCKLRGLECKNDTYALAQLHFHWGMDSSKGSEHKVCGSPRAAEMHMVFFNLRWFDMPWEQENPERGVRFLVMGSFIEEGDFNPEFTAILNTVQPPNHGDGFRDRGIVHWPNTSGPSRGDTNLANLLPQNYSTKFYTYPGALTTPPCSQKVTWFLFENAIQWSKEQLDQLRSSVTFYHFPHVHPHPYEAIIFPFSILAIGALTYHFLTRYFPSVPYTMVVMLQGFCIDALASTNNDGQLNPMQQSLRQWSNIDGHLLLYAFLPILLFGEVMKMNMHTFRQTFWQSFTLAGPGVMISTVLTALVLKYLFPYGWSFSLCMGMGAILSATDPVAVVDLMKHVGASPALTMQITGESLLNDGTAMIVFTIFFDLSRGRTYRPDMVIRYCARMFFLSPCLGLLVGLVALFLMGKASMRHSTSDAIVQLSFTLCAAYLAYFLGDHTKIAAASGILTCISAGLVLAWRVWPVVVSMEGLSNVWHAFEYIANTIIFALIGVSSSRAWRSSNVGPREFVYVVILYVAVFIIRAIVIAVSFPILNCVGNYKVTKKEAVFMWWGGLRGAVALGLALFVKNIMSNTIRTWPDDDDRDAERLMFMVAGVAFLTLTINAPTAAPMLRLLNLVSPHADTYVEKVRGRVTEAAENSYTETCLKLDHDASDAIEHIGALRYIKDTDRATPATSSKLDGAHRAARFWMARIESHELRMKREAFATLAFNSSLTPRPMSEKEVAAAAVGPSTPGGKETVMLDIQLDEPTKLEAEREDHAARGFSIKALESIQSGLPGADQSQLAPLRQMFLRVVNAQYWDMIDNGHLPKTAAATITLLQSIDVAMDDLVHKPLHDYEALLPVVGTPNASIRKPRVLHFFSALASMNPTKSSYLGHVRYKVSFEAYEVVYYVLRAFSLAHRVAQAKFVASLSGPDASAPESPEEVAILLESAMQVQAAEHRLEVISPNLKSIVKSKIVAETVMEMQHEAIYRLIKQGVLTDVDSEKLLAELESDSKNLAQSRRNQARYIAQVAAERERKSSRHGGYPPATSGAYDDGDDDDDNDYPGSATPRQLEERPTWDGGRAKSPQLQMKKSSSFKDFQEDNLESAIMSVRSSQNMLELVNTSDENPYNVSG